MGCWWQLSPGSGLGPGTGCQDPSSPNTTLSSRVLELGRTSQGKGLCGLDLRCPIMKPNIQVPWEMLLQRATLKLSADAALHPGPALESPRW